MLLGLCNYLEFVEFYVHPNQKCSNHQYKLDVELDSRADRYHDLVDLMVENVGTGSKYFRESLGQCTPNATIPWAKLRNRDKQVQWSHLTRHHTFEVEAKRNMAEARTVAKADGKNCPDRLSQQTVFGPPQFANHPKYRVSATQLVVNQ
jgi:hypothetical protein